MREEVEAPSVGLSIVLMPHVACPLGSMKSSGPGSLPSSWVCCVFFHEDVFIMRVWEIFYLCSIATVSLSRDGPQYRVIVLPDPSADRKFDIFSKVRNRLTSLHVYQRIAASITS